MFGNAKFMSSGPVFSLASEPGGRGTEGGNSCYKCVYSLHYGFQNPGGNSPLAETLPPCRRERENTESLLGNSDGPRFANCCAGRSHYDFCDWHRGVNTSPPVIKLSLRIVINF